MLRKSLRSDSTLIFLHIPKNAGTSLRKVMERFYPKREIYCIYAKGDGFHDIEDFYSLTAEEKKKVKVFIGHVEFGLHQAIPQSCCYGTILRNPVDRMLSLYAHVSQAPNHPYYSRIRTEDMSLRDFLKSGMAREADNYQTRALSGINPEYGMCTDKMLETAKENLDRHFAVIGIAEYFVESMMLMKEALGWKTPLYRTFGERLLGWGSDLYEKTNVSSNRLRGRDLSAEDLQVINELNNLDLDLYRYAKNIFERRLDDLGPKFQREAAVLKREILDPS